MSNWIRTYGKSVAAVVFAAVFAFQATIADGHVTTVEQVQIAIGVATAVGVYLVPLHPQWRWSKTAIAVVLAVLNVAITLIMRGWVVADWTDLILAALTALGVGAAPAQSRKSVPSAAPATAGR